MLSKLTEKQVRMLQYSAAAVAVLFFVLFFTLHKYPGSKGAGYGKIDFAVFYVAGASITGTMDTADFDLQPTDMFLNKKNFRAGIKEVRKQNGGTRFLYLPQSALLFTPFSFIQMKYANVLWMVLIAAAFIAAYYLSIWGLVKDSIWKFRYSALLALLPLSSPVQGLFSTGQVNSFVWLLLIGFFIAMARHRYMIAGTVLAIAVSIKVFPVIIGPYLLIRREWKVIASGIVAFLVLFGASLPFISFEAYRFYFENVLSSVISGDFISFTGTSAFSNIVMWIKHGWFDFTDLKRKKMIRNMEGVWQWFTYAGLAALYGMWFWLQRKYGAVVAKKSSKKSSKKKQEAAKHHDLLDYSLIMLFFLFFAKAIHQQYHFWILPLILLLMSYPLKKKYWSYHAVAVLALILTQFWKQFGLTADAVYFFKPATAGMLMLCVVAVLLRLGIQFHTKKRNI